MKIFAGLGNPGPKYQGNRHNIGFMAIDAIHRKLPFGPWSKKFKAEIAEGEIDGEKILLMKPQTFMNLSGDSVGEAMRFFKLTPADITVFHDELDLPAAKVRVKTGGGHGGHNGLKSLDAHCGRDYRRVRLGIGHPGDKELVHNHVLGDFAKVDQTWLDPLLDDIALNAGLLLVGDGSQFMNKLARGEPKEPAPKPKPSGQSHIRQARPHGQKPPVTGPMADMLKKLLGDKSD
ncbi:PTH1 family peptidyl-tRNA hydrolase [Rhizobium sp. SG_E_25_P2]|uniref:aminoacyl-tRNA hydrolase n=1 Tax=Rhizobium sp. SG_E_25_P2 TaxID=2879942 RepID=UPI002476F9F7|nr:aminoacyl-tRNA hydrolase [Rhizobium sp. SG_E_25_P2]MDH6266977.1 PTH1 family peptidyl-tRNA hydrolase [Rhizobium sp. SG_E_25_P2]